jgi:hypothetical protein
LPRLGVTDHDLAGADPDPGREPHPQVAADLLVQGGQLLAELERSSYGAQRVVLVRDRDPEYRHHHIPEEALQRAPVALQRGDGNVVGALDRRPHRLGIRATAVRHRTGQRQVGI